MDLKLVNNRFLKRAVFALPFLICFFIQLSKINNDIVSFSEVWWILSPFRSLETVQGGHTPYYYYLVRFIQIFNVFDIAPYAYLRFINCLFNIAALAYIYKAFKEFLDQKTAFLTILCLSLGSFFLGATVTTVRYPLVNLLFFFSLYNFFAYLRIRSNRYFVLFFISELIVTSLDTHAVFGCIFKIFYLVFYKLRIDRKLIIAAILLGINFIVTNFFIYIVARPFIWSHVGWLASQNNFIYFVNEFLPNFFFNTLSFEFPLIAWLALIVLFIFFIFILIKIRDRGVKTIALFISTCFLLLGLIQYATKLQCFTTKHFIFLVPFILSLFFYVIPERRRILSYLFCAFIGYNTVISYSAICASNYTYIFRAIERYRPTICLSLHGSGFVPETILKSLYPSIQIERVESIKSNSSYSAKTLMVVSSYNSNDFIGSSIEILKVPLSGYTKILDYYFEYCPGYTCVYSIYKREIDRW